MGKNCARNEPKCWGEKRGKAIVFGKRSNETKHGTASDLSSFLPRTARRSARTRAVEAMVEVQERAREIAVTLDDGLEKLLRGALKKAVQGFRYALATLALLAGCLLLATSTFLVLRALIVPSITEHVKELHFDFRKEHPEALASFLDEKYLLNTSHTKPNTPTSARFLPANQKFDLSIEMNLPESVENQRLGMFQVTVELLTTENDTIIATASRPVMIQYKSQLVHLGRTLLFLPLLVMGWSTEAQKIRLMMFSNMAESKILPFATLRVLMQPRAGVNAVPQVYNAKATVVLRLGTFAGILKRWRWTTSLYGIVILYIIFVYTAGFYLLLTMFRKKPSVGQMSDQFRPGEQNIQTQTNRVSQERGAELELEQILQQDQLPKDEDGDSLDEATNAPDIQLDRGEESETDNFPELRQRIIRDRGDAY